MPKLLTKPFDYDLLIANLNKYKIANIYYAFQEDTLKDSFVDISMSSSYYTRPTINKEDDKKSIYKKITTHGNVVKLVLKKNKETIEFLKEKPYEFNFSNCNLSDNKPILCINKQLGDSFKSEKNEEEQNKKIMIQLKDQKFIELDDWNWAAHDYHHAEAGIDTGGKDFIDISKIGGKESKRITGYKGPKNTGYEYIDKEQNLVVSEDYWLKVIGLYFNKTGFTKGVSGKDIWASIYAYCLTKMSSEDDASKIDFSIVNEKGKRPLIIGEGSRKNLVKFFKAAYKNVHNFSTLSRFSSEDPKNLIHKLQDGYIYIYLF